MSESKLRDLSMDFSVQIMNLVKDLKSKHETVISNQIGRSGTSIGANIYEANYAQGRKDFISKLEIALKEASETGYWLELLNRTKYIDETTYKSLNDQPELIYQDIKLTLQISDNVDHGTSFRGRQVGLFHSILYFFTHLFGRRSS